MKLTEKIYKSKNCFVGKNNSPNYNIEVPQLRDDARYYLIELLQKEKFELAMNKARFFFHQKIITTEDLNFVKKIKLLALGN